MKWAEMTKWQKAMHLIMKALDFVPKSLLLVVLFMMGIDLIRFSLPVFAAYAPVLLCIVLLVVVNRYILKV